MKKQSGASAIEYALVAFLIGIAIVAGAGAVGRENLALWSEMVEKVLAVIGL